jgi:hypothetical protein
MSLFVFNVQQTRHSVFDFSGITIAFLRISHFCKFDTAISYLFAYSSVLSILHEHQLISEGTQQFMKYYLLPS